MAAVEKSFWVVLCLVMMVGQVTNSIEQPFARSIVACDTPLDTALGSPSSYSLLCGDRLRVIGEGALIAGQGQSLENLAKFVTFPLVGIFADILGRKPLVIAACASVTLSTFMFVVAAYSPLAAPSLFVVAQGLQGMTGGDTLLHIMVNDVAAHADSDKQGFYVMKDQVFGLAMISSLTLGQIANAMEFQHYGVVWILASVFNVIALVLGVLYFPETKRPVTIEKEQQQQGLRQAIGAELQTYRNLFSEVPLMRCFLLKACIGACTAGVLAQFGHMIMAYFGYSQREVLVRMLPLQLCGLLTAPLVIQLCKRFGYSFSFIRLGTARTFIFAVCCGFYTTHWTVPWLLMVATLPFSGFDSLQQMLIPKVVSERLNAKFHSFVMMSSFLSNSFVSYVYSKMFDAKAETYFGRNASPNLAIVFAIMDILLFVRIAPQMKQGLEALEAEAREETGKEKKTD